ncbi:MAG TPA: hypothetical protein VK445_02990 [Dissulfurispiraceae bacterium]|nr:hypothetical protein [Dissulfurispiraceae bacterium]
MKANNQTTRKAACWGAAAGLILFTIVGLLPSSFVGGVLGLKIAGILLGGAADAALLSRAIVGASMVAGVLVAGLVFVMGSALAAWAGAQIVFLGRHGHIHETA